MEQGHRPARGLCAAVVPVLQEQDTGRPAPALASERPVPIHSMRKYQRHCGKQVSSNAAAAWGLPGAAMGKAGRVDVPTTDQSSVQDASCCYVLYCYLARAASFQTVTAWTLLRARFRPALGRMICRLLIIN